MVTITITYSDNSQRRVDFYEKPKEFEWDDLQEHLYDVSIL